jgi:tellurite resistance protein
MTTPTRDDDTEVPIMRNTRRRGSVTKIPLNFFGIPFGLAGLGELWTFAARYHDAPRIIADIVLLVSATVWLLVVSAYLRHLVFEHATLRKDLLDPIAAPFASLALITPVLLSAVGLYPHAETLGRALTDVFLCLTVLLGGWFTGQWIYGSLALDTFHPGYFLPTVAGGLVASAAAAAVGQQRLSEVMFGLGLICWIVMGSIILGRLLFRPMLPQALQPTLAIEIAPAAVASLAWFQIHGEQIDTVAAVLGGYGLLMVIAQLRLAPLYSRLPFMPSTWAFTFSWAAVATAVLVWLHATHVTGYVVWQYVVLAVISILIGGISARSVLAISRRQLLPAAVPVAPVDARARAAHDPPVRSPLKERPTCPRARRPRSPRVSPRIITTPTSAAGRCSTGKPVTRPHRPWSCCTGHRPARSCSAISSRCWRAVIT